eukprot:934627-Amphidinium_carterae.1
MTLVVNAGEQEGLSLCGWKKIVDHYEPHERTRFAGQLLSLRWLGRQGAENEAGVKAFQREAVRYESQSPERYEMEENGLGKDGKSKGKGKSDKTCHYCGKAGHFQADSWLKNSGKGKGAKGERQHRKRQRGKRGQVWWTGYMAKQCPSRLNELSHDDGASSSQQANAETNPLSALYRSSCARRDRRELGQ